MNVTNIHRFSTKIKTVQPKAGYIYYYNNNLNKVNKRKINKTLNHFIQYDTILILTLATGLSGGNVDIIYWRVRSEIDKLRLPPPPRTMGGENPVFYCCLNIKTF